MATCCDTSKVAAPPRLVLACPDCGDAGKTVANVTVRALTKPELVDQLSSQAYNLCMNAACAVSYYAPEARTLRQSDLLVPLSHKEGGDDRIVCYCHKLKASDVLGEMRKNPEARSFKTIAKIFQLNDCNCELHHPFGGGCACATDIGRVVKQGLADPEVLDTDARAASRPALRVYYRSESCCGPSKAEELADFLKRRCDWANVSSFNLATPDERTPVTPALMDLLATTENGGALPAILLDDEILFSGKLPNFLEVMGAVSRRRRKADA